MQSTPERKPCGTCGERYTVTAAGGMRSHFTDNPEWQAGPDSRKCKGVGGPPAGAAPAGTAGSPQCRLCKHPVTLTDNGRARSHLTPEATPRPCPAGSDFPLGTYPDTIGTTDGLVATLAFDCEHREIGACYDCYAARSEAPWGVQPDAVNPPTMADQLKAAPTDDFGQPVRECFNCDRVGCAGCGAPSADDGRPQASKFMDLLERETRGAGTVEDAFTPVERARLDAVVATDHRTPEQKAADARTSELTDKAITALQQRTPEQKAETAARMDRVVSQALGAPLDPALNHRYTDSTGVEWVHEGPEETCQSLDCRLLRNCEQCDTDNHRCPGCGDSVPHGTVACTPCDRRVMANRLPKGETDDGRPCYHDDAMFGLEDGRTVCIACGTPCTHPEGFTENDPTEDDGEGLVFTCVLCGAVDSGDELPDDAEAQHLRTTLDELDRQQAGVDAWRTPADLVAKMPEFARNLDAMQLNCMACGHPVTPLVDRFDLYGDPEVIAWTCKEAITSGYQTCRDHECTPDTQARLGDLDEGDYFIRRGTLMRLTERESASSVLAVIVGGPYDGRTGELKNLNEIVERAPAPRTEEQETKECTDGTMKQQPRSSAEDTTTAAPAPGSPRATKASAPAVSSSTKATSSAPTAPAAGNGRSAVATTEQDAAARFLGSGQAAPAQPDSVSRFDAQAAAAAQFLAGGSGAHGEKETKRDRFGRYLIPHPDTGKEQAWTRATTFAKSISDTYALGQWGLRMALIGATLRPDIVQRAHGKHVSADKQLLDELTADLKNAAGDKVAANLGTSMHSFKELADKAWHSPGGPRSVMGQVPPDCRADIETYIRLLDELGLEPVSHLVEFTTVVKQYGVAGTSDNCYKVTRPLMLKIGRAEVRLSPGEYVIADLKTGKDLDYGWQEIAIQLSVYAQGINTAGVWDRHEETWIPDPLGGAKVRTDVGIVVHLPVDKSGKKQPAVYGIDLESGWNAAVLCERVREWRKFRNLAAPVMVSETADTFAPSRPEPAVVSQTTVRPPTLMERAQSVTSKGEASAVWQAAKQDGLPDAEVDKLIAVMQARLAELEEKAG